MKMDDCSLTVTKRVLIKLTDSRERGACPSSNGIGGIIKPQLNEKDPDSIGHHVKDHFYHVLYMIKSSLFLQKFQVLV